MSNERFDRLMKKNLESVKPGYQPKAWDRFRKRLPLGFWARLLPYGGWVLSALMLTGWLTTLRTLHTNQQVMERLIKTVTVQADSAKQVVKPTVLPVLTHRVDTVYIVQRTVVEHRYVREREVNVPRLNVPASEYRLAPTSPQVAPSTVGDRSNVGQSRVNRLSRQQPGTSGERGIDPANEARPIVADTKVVQADSTKRVTDGATAAIKVDPDQNQSTKLTPVKTDSVAQRPTNGSATAAATAPAVLPAKQSRPPFRLSSLQPRVGVETNATLYGLGVGPAIEFFPTENLGISLGVQASQLQLEEHKELRDFNAATGMEFIEKYRTYLPAQYDRINDISVQTSVVSLPLFLKYYVPLHRNWSLLFQTGTSFDVAAYQQVRYESYYQGAEQYHSFEVDAQPRFFHNFMFGAGIQYRRPRLSAQLSPYYLYDFRSIINTPAGSNVGVKASIWLDLFK